MAVKAASKLHEKPDVEDVKKSLDKSKIIFQGHSSSE